MFGEELQRWQCRECEHRFSDPLDLEKAKKALHDVQTIESKELKRASAFPTNRQICDEILADLASTNPIQGTKNLVTEQINKVVPQKPELSIEQRQKLKGAIVEYMWNLQKNGASEDTYMPYSENLKFLVKNNAALFNPDDVKTVITFLNKKDIRKYNLVKAYKSFMNFVGIKGDMPTYSYIRKLSFIPRADEIDQLITGCANYCKQMSIFLQLLKETGARAGEAYRLTWTDIDDFAKTVSIRPEKGSNPRLNRISEKLLRLLISLQKTAVPDPKARVFAWKKKAYIGKSFRRMRKRIVANTGNQRLLKIHFHTLRYWKGTVVYVKTRSLAHVMVQLGHKSWSSAQLYVSLSEAIAQPDEKWVTAVARTLEEALKLTNAGFVYDTDWEPGVKIYKKQVANE
jgi:integrase